MNKRVILAAGAALAVLTSACSSSTPATPTISSTDTSTTDASSTDASSTDVSSTDVSSRDVSSTDTSSTDVSSTDASSTDTSSTDTSSEVTGDSADGSTSSTAPSVTEPSTSGSDSSTVSSSAPSSSALGVSSPSLSTTGTVGDTSGKLDAQTTAWFTTLCNGLAPLSDLSKTLTAGGTPDLKSYSTKVSNLGKAFTNTSNKLKTQPPPTFPGGANYGTKATQAFKQLGSVFSQLGDKVSKGDISGLSKLSSQINTGPIKDLQQLKVEPATDKAISELPACKKIDFGG